MNFEVVTNKRFKIGVDVYFRNYRIVEKRNGLLKLVNAFNGVILIDNLRLEDVQISGKNITHINELQEVIYNTECGCDPTMLDSDYKIFDLTFDNTFE